MFFLKIFLHFVLLLKVVKSQHVPSPIDAQQWNSNLLNLFSDNFRNLLQQIPTSPLSTSSIQNPLTNYPSSLSSPFSSSDYDYDFNKYSRSKADILQYSDEDPINRLNNGLTNTLNNPTGQLPNQLTYNSFANDQFNRNQPNNYAYQLNPSTKSQFDEDPIYDVLAKTNQKKNLAATSIVDLNRNINWDDSNLGINPTGYNLDNIYNNRFNYNRLPVAPADHFTFLPPTPNLQLQSNQAIAKPIINNDLQQSSGTSNLQFNSQLMINQPSLQSQSPLLNLPSNQPVNKPVISNDQPQSAFSSFLASNNLDISNFDISSFNGNGQLSPIQTPIQTPLQTPLQTPIQSPIQSPIQTSNVISSNNKNLSNLPNHQMISTNSVEQQYEQAKPKFTNLLTTETRNNLPIQSPIASNSLQSTSSISNSINSLPDDALIRLYQTFASAAFNVNHNSFSSNNDPVENRIVKSNPIDAKNKPGVIYYDNFINHQTSSSPIDSITNLTTINNDSTSLATLTTNVVAPNLDDKLKLDITTPKIQIKSSTPLPTTTNRSRSTRKKSVKIKRKNHQRTNQHASRRKKDELEAIEK